MTLSRFDDSEPASELPSRNARANTGFLNIFVGGVGAKAGGHVLERHRADEAPFAMTAFHLDTDPATTLATPDGVLIQLTGGDIRSMRANPTSFGPIATSIIYELDRMLSPGDTLHGSRTTRGLTQLAFLFHEERLYRALRLSLNRLLEQFKVTHVMPVIVSSSGGGTGSASQILLGDLFDQPTFRHRLLGGIPADLLLPPMSFVVEPFAYANETSLMQARKIAANAMAFRVESECLLARRAMSYVTHIGYANDAGVVLADPALMAKVLGYAVYEIERCWPDLKARWVDGPDDIASITTYGGQDSPEFEHDANYRLQVRRNHP